MSLGNRTPPTVNEYQAYKDRFTNWGRWGDDDQLGTLNHITAETRRSAAPLATGLTVALAIGVFYIGIFPHHLFEAAEQTTQFLFV